MTDIAATLDRLVPGGDWQGSVTDNTRAAFDAVRWQDARTKPTWAAVVAASDAIDNEPPPTKREVIDASRSSAESASSLTRSAPRSIAFCSRASCNRSSSTSASDDGSVNPRIASAID